MIDGVAHEALNGRQNDQQVDLVFLGAQRCCSSRFSINVGNEARGIGEASGIEFKAGLAAFLLSLASAWPTILNFASHFRGSMTWSGAADAAGTRKKAPCN